MVAALAAFAVLVVVLVTAWSLRLVSRMAEQSEARLVGMVESLHGQLSSTSATVLHVLEESLKPPPPSPLEVARERMAAEELERTERFDDSDPFDGLLPPADRPVTASLGDGPNPFGIPGLQLDREGWS